MRVLLTSLFILISGYIVGQNELSLKDAINVGLQNNYQIQIAKLQSAQSALNNTWGEAGRYPSLNLNATQGNNLSDQSNNPTAFIQALTMSNSLQGGLNLDWVLFNGFSVKANKQKLEKIQEQSEGNAAVVIENTVQAIILAYYSVKLQEDKLDVLNSVLQTSKDRYEYNQLKEELGTAVSVDLLQFQNAVLTDSTSVMLQQIALKNAKRNLNIIINVPQETEYSLTNDFFDDFPSYTFDDLQTKMEGNNQNLKNQYINSEIFQKDISLAKASMFPVISFQAGASANSSRYKIGEFPSQSGTNLNYYGNFTLSFNLFNGGKVKRAIQGAEIQERINELQIDNLKQTLNQDLLQAFELYNTRLKIYQLSQQSVDVSKRNLTAAQEKYNAGVINSFNFRDINTAYLNAGINALEALFNLIDSKTELTRLTGGLVQE